MSENDANISTGSGYENDAELSNSEVNISSEKTKAHPKSAEPTPTMMMDMGRVEACTTRATVASMSGQKCELTV